MGVRLLDCTTIHEFETTLDIYYHRLFVSSLNILRRLQDLARVSDPVKLYMYL